MQKLRIDVKEINKAQWLYSQDWVYHDYGNCKRHLQIIFPYKSHWSEGENYPLILFIPGSAWHKQEMYNDIPQYAKLAALFHAHGLCEKLPKLSGVILESASTDLLICSKNPLPPWMQVRPSAVLLGVDKIEGNEELARKASCDRYVTKEIALPPVLLIHSEFDPVVSVENSRVLYEKLAATGHEAVYYELEGLDAHGGAVYYSEEVLGIVKEFCENARQ